MIAIAHYILAPKHLEAWYVHHSNWIWPDLVLKCAESPGDAQQVLCKTVKAWDDF